MSQFPGFGDYYDLRPLKEYVEKSKIMDKFTPEQQEDLKAMAKEFEKYLQGGAVKWHSEQ